jgi:hypothetical protein
LGNLGGSAVSDLLDAEGSKLGFKIRELTEKLSIVLIAKFKSLRGLYNLIIDTNIKYI